MVKVAFMLAVLVTPRCLEREEDLQMRGRHHDEDGAVRARTVDRRRDGGAEVVTVDTAIRTTVTVSTPTILVRQHRKRSRRPIEIARPPKPVTVTETTCILIQLVLLVSICLYYIFISGRITCGRMRHASSGHAIDCP